ncbi:MAG: UPF0182 family protein [Elusimicrobia bacterium]|nr:UPF0182 family protein [Elusimicrobiota bacterium]
MTLLLAVALLLAVLHLFSVARRKGDLPAETVIRDLFLAVASVVLLRAAASFQIELAWWRELGHEAAFWRLIEIRWVAPSLAAGASFLILAGSFHAARRRSLTPVAQSFLFAAGGTAVAALVGTLLSFSAIDPWTSALWWTARSVPGYTDPIFGRGLAFYFYKLPFYQMVLGWAGALTIFAFVGYAFTLLVSSSTIVLLADPETPLSLREAPARVLTSLSSAARWGGAALLALFAAGRFLARYELLYSTHRFLYGADFVDARLGIPLDWVQAVLALALAVLIAAAPRRRFLVSEGLGLADAALGALPGWLSLVLGVGALAALLAPPLLLAAVRSLYVQPNELTLERPYIKHHIDATLQAYDLAADAHEEPYVPRDAETLDLSKDPGVAENLRLWDWSPFSDNITQRQTLRQYYAFPNVDTDRYLVDGRMRQVLISGRGLETGLLPQNAQTWVNLNLQYTHGYGAVAALVNSATAEGAPEMLLKDAPPQSDVPAFQIKRPEIYFGAETDAPVFVDGDQKEFDYPKGDDNAYTTYDGTAGIPIGRPWMRFAAAIARGDWNILLTSYLTKDSKLLLHRQIQERVQRLAPFLTLDSDPYLVIDDSGRMFWMLDAYTSTDLHPYSQPLQVGDQSVNYIRNSVKVTVDAYNGTVRFYVFDEKDPLLAAYRRLFPDLFEPRSAMPPDLERHIRYPEGIFDAQAEIYRTYHMRDPQVFYNKEDQWDIAKQIVTQESTQFMRPYYAMLPLPGDQKAEFALMLPFTSHNRDNMIAWIAARCDPPHYGEIVFYRLPKEELIYGPLQVQSRIDQVPQISQDLSLWNQQGSRVLRGHILVLPVDGTFLYVEPIYIQSTQARMPELKKVILVVGNHIVYADDLPTAIRELARPPASPSETLAAAPLPAESATAPLPPAPKGETAVLRALRAHFAAYRRYTAAGELEQAGRELDAMQAALEAAPPPAPRRK